MTIRPLMTLQNGAKLKAVTELNPTTFVVLATWHNPGFEEWITWQCDNNGNCYWGHYFRDRKEAYKDYEKRINTWLD